MADYINRDDAIKTYCDGCPLYVKCVSDGIECSKMQMFKRIPAADVRENVHGEWKHTGAYPHKVYCSLCFATYLHNEKWAAEMPITLHPNFCPNCGADMRGDNNG